MSEGFHEMTYSDDDKYRGMWNAAGKRHGLGVVSGCSSCACLRACVSMCLCVCMSVCLCVAKGGVDASLKLRPNDMVNNSNPISVLRTAMPCVWVKQ